MQISYAGVGGILFLTMNASRVVNALQKRMKLLRAVSNTVFHVTTARALAQTVFTNFSLVPNKLTVYAVSVQRVGMGIIK
jgi:hypothetical protein